MYDKQFSLCRTACQNAYSEEKKGRLMDVKSIIQY